MSCSWALGWLGAGTSWVVISMWVLTTVELVAGRRGLRHGRGGARDYRCVAGKVGVGGRVRAWGTRPRRKALSSS